MRTILFTTLLSGLLSASYGAVVIDDFSDAAGPSGTTNISVSGGANIDTPSSNFTGTGLTNVLGGERKTTVQRTAATGSATRQVAASISDSGPSFLEYTSSGGANGFVSVAYGDSVSLNQNFSANNLFRISFEDFDGAGGPLVTSLSLTSGVGTSPVMVTSSLSLLSALTGSTIMDFDLTSGDFAGLDLADVDRIQVIFDPGFGADFTVNSITAIPEPNTALLGFAGCALILVLRRRRR
jgi:hypothetical protein